MPDPQEVKVVSPVPIPVRVVDEEPPTEDRRKSLAAPASNIQYIVAVMFMMALGVVSIVVLTVSRPGNTDNTLIITTIIGFLAPTTLSLLAFMKSQETHLSVNSRLDQFMSNARLAARAQGVTEGRAQGRESADARTDALRNQTP